MEPSVELESFSDKSYRILSLISQPPNVRRKKQMIKDAAVSSDISQVGQIDSSRETFVIFNKNRRSKMKQHSILKDR
jgi:hypothetical protein